MLYSKDFKTVTELDTFIVGIQMQNEDLQKMLSITKKDRDELQKKADLRSIKSDLMDDMYDLTEIMYDLAEIMYDLSEANTTLNAICEKGDEVLKKISGNIDRMHKIK